MSDVALSAARSAMGESVTYSRGARTVVVTAVRGGTGRGRDDVASEARLTSDQCVWRVVASELVPDGETEPLIPQLGDTLTDGAGLVWQVAPLRVGDPPWRPIDRCPNWLLIQTTR